MIPLVPNSYGVRLREFNPCHSPKSGQFAPRGQGKCDPGEVTDPGRTRAVYGQQYDGDDLKERLNLDTMVDELSALDDHLNSSDDGDDIKSAKDDITQSLASKLGRDLGAGVHTKFYNAFSDAIEDHYDEIGGDSEKHQEEYDEWFSEQENELRQQAEDEAFKSHKKARDKYAESVGEAVQVLREEYDNLLTPYGSPKVIAEQPLLDLDIEVDGGPPTVDPVVFLQKEFPDFYDEETGFDADGLKKALADDPEARAKLDRLANAEVDFSVADNVAEMDYDLDEISRSAYDQWMTGSKYFETHPGDLDARDDKGFKQYADNEGINFEDPDTGGIGSYDEWAESQGYKENELDYNDIQKTTSYLIHKWANTSGDADPMSLAMQFAINEEFDLGATYSGHYVERDYLATTGAGRGETHAVTKARGILAAHGDFLRPFVRTMHTRTQRALDLDVPEYVTVFRGFNLDPGEEKTLKTVDLKNGTTIDVLLQPASSFSTDINTAKNFGGYGGTPMIMAMRVPRKQILSTARTGFGALNEHEIVLLGGRYPATVFNSAVFEYNRGRTMTAFEKAAQRYRSSLFKTPVEVGRGDAL